MSAISPSVPAAPELSRAEFARIAAIAHAEAGLCLSPAKGTIIASRIAKRLRATGTTDLSAYLEFVDGPSGENERRCLISALTTNVSHFFREAHHFAILERDVLPALAARARAGGRVRLWSAGCSTGQEPYSIAMTILRILPEAPRLDMRILASDIDDTVLGFAREGVYDARQIAGVDHSDRQRFFTRVAGRGEAERYSAGDALRSLIRFRHLNLVRPWPMTGPFDAIFCRNVVIYFDGATQSELWPRFERALAPGGYLFLGHSERLDPAIAPKFQSAGVTAHRKPDAAGPGTGKRETG